MQDSLVKRVTELEIRLALQDDTLDALNRHVNMVYQQLDAQQKQLQLLYRKLSESADATLSTNGNEPPPHY